MNNYEYRIRLTFASCHSPDLVVSMWFWTAMVSVLWTGWSCFCAIWNSWDGIIFWFYSIGSMFSCEVLTPLHGEL